MSTKLLLVSYVIQNYVFHKRYFCLDYIFAMKC